MRKMLVAVVLAVVVCSGYASSQEIRPTPESKNDAAIRPNGAGAVYALTNDGFNNEVFAYSRSDDGTLGPRRRFATGGKGSGVFESSTGMLILASVSGQSSPVNLGGGSNLLFAANAGSDSISVFRVRHNGGLDLVDVQPSGGDRPISQWATLRLE